MYVKKIVADKTGDGVPDVETFRAHPRRRPDVRRRSSPPTRPAPDRENPKCEKADAPPWVGNAEEVSFGGS